ncbi:hypothetical protein Golax_010788, partial [Gossypium laxum]|nr:hypothetical protein [Gossypium laxum]
MVGKVAKSDFNTDSKARGRYACMVLYINLGKPLLLQVLISENTQRIEYESLPIICLSCGRYSHLKETCLQMKEVVAILIKIDTTTNMALVDSRKVVQEAQGPRKVISGSKHSRSELLLLLFFAANSIGDASFSMNKASTCTSLYKGVITHFNPTFESPEEVLLDQKLVTHAQKINQW